MRKRRQFFFPRRRWPRCKGRTIDDRSIEEYEQKKRTDVTKEMKNSTLKVNTRIRPVSCRSKWWYYRTVYTWNVMFEHSVFRFLYVRELLDRSNRSTCFCVLATWGVPFFFFFFIFLFFLSLAKLDKWNFEQNRICNCLSSLSRSTRIEIVSIKETISLVIYVEISVGGIYIYVCMYMYVYITYANTIVYNVWSVDVQIKKY